MNLWQQAQAISALEHDLKLLIGPLIYPHELGDLVQIAAALGCSERQLKKQLRAFIARSEGAWFNRSSDFEAFVAHEHVFELSLDAGLSLDWQMIWNALPSGWEPDLIIWKHLFVFPPQDLMKCPCPVILLAGDWHLQYASVLQYLQAFDFILGDRMLLQKLHPSQACAYWPSYGFSERFFQGDVFAERPWDIAFAGSLRHSIHAERNTYLYRLAQLGDRYRVCIETQLYDERYLAFWQQSKVAFNFALRKEMNLRAFEAVASGALLFQEETNLEIQDFLPPGVACVLYNQNNFETQIDYYLNHEKERLAIALEGQRRIQSFTYTHQTALLLKVLPVLIPLLPEKPIRFRAPIHQQAFDLARVQQGLFSSHEKLHTQASKFLYLSAKQSDHLFVKRSYLNAYLISRIQCHWNLLETPQIVPQKVLEIELIEKQLELCQHQLGPHPLVQNSLIWSAFSRNDRVIVRKYLEMQGEMLKNFSVPHFSELLAITPQAWEKQQKDFQAELCLWSMVLMQGQSRFHLAWQQALSQNTKLLNLLLWSLNYAWGHFLLKENDLQGAETHFSKAVQLAPELPEAYFALALLMLKTQRVPLAIEALRYGLMQGIFYPAEWRLLLRLLLDLNAVPPAMQCIQTLKILFQSSFFIDFQHQLQNFELEALQRHRDMQGQLPEDGFLG